MLTRLLAVVVTAAALAAQTQAAPPLLHLATDQAGVVRAAGMVLSIDTSDLAIGEKEHAEITIGADRVAKASKVGSPMPAAHTEITVAPAAWLRAADADVKALIKQWGPRLDAILQQVGMGGKQGKNVIDNLYALLLSTEQVRLRVAGMKPNALDIAITCTPAADSAFAAWVKALVANPDGAAVLSTKPASVTFVLSAAPASVAAAMQPIQPMMAEMYAGGEYDRAKVTAMFGRSLAAWDGTFSMDLGADGMHMAMGVRDPKAFAASMVDPEYLAMTKGYLARQKIEGEYTPNALTHRGVIVLKSKVTTDKPNPMMPDGEMTSMAGVAGNTWVALSGPPNGIEAAIKLAIDAALDGKLARRQPTVAGDQRPALLSLDIDIDALMAQMSSGRGLPPLGDDAPKAVHITLHKTDTTLEARIALR